MIYIIKYPHRTEIVGQEFFENEVKACYNLGLNWVVNRYNDVSKTASKTVSKTVSKELVIIV